MAPFTTISRFAASRSLRASVFIKIICKKKRRTKRFFKNREEFIGSLRVSATVKVEMSDLY